MHIKRKLPNISYEKMLWEKGLRYVAGVDEVGRGSFAGPVVAGCVVFSSNSTGKLKDLINEKNTVEINDSKKLTRPKREKADEWIRKNALVWGIGKGEVAEINKKGVGNATKMAFRRAVKAVNEKLKDELDKSLDYLLLDSYYVPYIRGLPKYKSKNIKGHKKYSEKLKILNSDYSRQLAIVKGDQKSLSIAAGSIIAKVYRDKMMVKLANEFADYGWEKNKGYGTKEHRDAIRQLGTSKHHRLQFVESFLNGVSG